MAKKPNYLLVQVSYPKHFKLANKKRIYAKDLIKFFIKALPEEFIFYDDVVSLYSYLLRADWTPKQSDYFNKIILPKALSCLDLSIEDMKKLGELRND